MSRHTLIAATPEMRDTTRVLRWDRDPTWAGAYERPVLVIDDEAEMRMFLADTLRAAGFVVEEATSGEEGRRRLDRGGIDVVLLTIGWRARMASRACRLSRAGIPGSPSS